MVPLTCENLPFARSPNRPIPRTAACRRPSAACPAAIPRAWAPAPLDQSLGRLGLDYVDVFYHHRPDPDTPLEETMGALAQAVTSGKALYVGLSNYNGEQLEAATRVLADLRVSFVINQNRYSILDRTVEDNGLLEATERLRKGLICFSPLAKGLLTDCYLDGIPADSRAAHDPRFLHPTDVERAHATIVRLNEIAQGRGQTLAEMSVAWLLAHKAVTSVLIGAPSPSKSSTTSKRSRTRRSRTTSSPPSTRRRGWRRQSPLAGGPGWTAWAASSRTAVHSPFQSSHCITLPPTALQPLPFAPPTRPSRWPFQAEVYFRRM